MPSMVEPLVKQESIRDFPFYRTTCFNSKLSSEFNVSTIWRNPSTKSTWKSGISVQVSLLTDWAIERTQGTIQWRSSSGLFYGRPLCTVLAWAGMSTLRRCPPRIFSATSGITHPPRCPEGWFWRVSWHVTCPNHASFCLWTVVCVILKERFSLIRGSVT